MKNFLIFLSAFLSAIGSIFAAEVTVRFSGLEEGDQANLTIASSTYLQTLPATSDGTYVFTDVPEGIHSVKAEARGYNVIEALTVIVDGNGNVSPSEPLKIPLTKMDPDPGVWNFQWKEDGSPSGYTTTANVNKPAEIEYLGKQIVPADLPSSAVLQNEYNILLADDEKPWTQEYAYRMVETLKTLPLDYYEVLSPAKFSLTADHLEDDITIAELENGYEVRISEDVFYYANPFLVNLDGVRGKLYSKRLHHALTNYLTDFGQNTVRVDQILRNRFGCRIQNVNYEELTRGITDEDAGCFQQFHPTELVSIINMFEELPEGFHQTPHLNYLIRRQDGHPHPLYPEATAVSWCVENGYIEFMSSCIGDNNQDFDTLRLILHEKTHFLWEYTFSDAIKEEWIEIGGWYKDPNSGTGWSTTKDVEFVSAYAHGKNPNEDMAESVAHYLKDPELLMSRSREKYDFIRDRIMHGTRYLSTVPDHLSFEVLNLWPDYDYPGKIKRVNVSVLGEPEEDKLVTIEIELNHIDGYDDGAASGGVRITSPAFKDPDGLIRTQFADLGFSPVDGNPHILSGQCRIPKYGKTGHWTVGDIVIGDLNGNMRYEGRNDCVVDIFVNNPLEDIEPPVYVPGSLEYELTESELEGHHCQNLKISFKATDNVGIASTYVSLYAASESAEGGGRCIAEGYGNWEPETSTGQVNFTIYDYFPTTDYYVANLGLEDMAGTGIAVLFSKSPLHQPVQSIHIDTPNPDTTHPEIDLNRIFVYAEPTHPEAPDGETKVTINFYCRDDNSGFGPCHYHFIDPQGTLHGNYWYYHRNFYTNFFDGDPTVWEHYKIVHILPQGSVPGRWGLGQMMVCDKAGNEFIYNFVETLIFEPDDDMSKYILFADMDDSGVLYLKLSSDSGSHFGYNYRVIHEETGQEINGTYTPVTPAFRSKAANDNPDAHSIDISKLPDGELVVIVNVLDENGKVETSKSSKIKKVTTTAVTGIALNETTCEMIEGETLTLVATMTPEDATDKTIIWSSSDENVAIVEDGVVTAIRPGEAVISASTANGLAAECVITVIEKAPELILVSEIYIDPEYIEAKPNTTVQVYVEVHPEDASYPTLTWTSSDEEVAQVTQEGLITVLKVGTAIITATATDGSGISAECHVDCTTGIQSILDKDVCIAIYNADGLLIKEDADISYVSTLSSGVYIIKSVGRTYKIVKR